MLLVLSDYKSNSLYLKEFIDCYSNTQCATMIVLLAILVVLTAYTLWMRRDIYRISWLLPGPFAFPIIGNALLAHPKCKLKVF